MWDVETGREALMLALHDAPVRAFALGPSGALVVAGGQDGLVCVAELATGRVLARIPLGGRIRCLATHPRAPLIACGGDGGRFHLVELVGLESSW